ncbi:MAG: hypothetical protein J7K17_00645 [Candidatus Omnitrophica bacterium]|nr:hypothetical protein [Candidatus Omnitrophota bacterium]
MILKKFEELSKIATKEFADIVIESKILFMPNREPLKLRLFLFDDTIIDIWLSVKGKYSYHWEQRPIRDFIYRHDNAPHKKWENLKTFPKHFHKGSETAVEESYISERPEEAIRDFLQFVREKMRDYFRK